MNTVNNKRASLGVKIMKAIVNSKERKWADRELERRIKELDRKRLTLVSMEQIARGKRLFAAWIDGMETGTESEDCQGNDRKHLGGQRKPKLVSSSSLCLSSSSSLFLSSYFVCCSTMLWR